jgi:hypothetical protein
MRVLLFVILSAVAFEIKANLTNIMQEPFVGVGVLNSSTPGNLGTVTGNFYKSAIGPYTSGNGPNGWSAALRGTSANDEIWHQIATTGGALTNGLFGAWFWIDSYTVPSGNNIILEFINDNNSAGLNKDAYLELNNVGGINLQVYGYGLQSNVYIVPVDNWFWMGLSWTKVGSIRTVSAYVYTNGVFAQLGTNITDLSWSASSISWAGGGEFNFSEGPFYVGRYGMPTLYAMGSSSDVAYSAATLSPPNPPYTWYCAPARGNDGNTGLAGYPWLTITNLNSQMMYGGIFSHTNNVPGSGDTVIVDNSVPLDLGTNQFLMGAAGGHYLFTNGPLVLHEILTNSSWTLVPGSTYTYCQSDNNAPDLTNIVVWENWMWMNHPEGTIFSAVSAMMDSTPGSFFSDGQYVYVHPFGNTDPITDGNLYTRSRDRGEVGDAISAVYGYNSNLWVDGLSASNTCVCRSYDNDPAAAYVLELTANGNGTNLISNFVGGYGSKHLIGRSASSSGMCVIRSNCFYGPCSPYVAAGGQTEDVDFVGISGQSNNSCAYINCACPNNAGLIGGFGCVNTDLGDFWTSHGVGVPFINDTFTNLNVCCGLNEQGFTTNMYVTNSVFGAANLYCKFDIYNSSTTEGPIAELGNAEGVVQNCIMNVNKPNSSYSFANLAGTLIVENCTIDMRGWSNSGLYQAVWGESAKSKLTFYNNVMIVNPGSDFTLLYNFSIKDTLVLSNNVYQSGRANYIVKDYFDGTTTANRTLSQWQTLGFDENSINPIDARIETNTERPYFDSPARMVGVPLGVYPDFTGFLFPNRKTAGAIEATFNGNWRGFQ